MSTCREAITHLRPVGSDESFRTLIACTKSRIYSSNDVTGNWRLLADHLGGDDGDGCLTCSPMRFSTAQLGNYVLFTNNFNKPLAWRFGDAPSGADLWSAHYIEDLELIGITSCRCITEFNGFIIIGDVHLEGSHFASRIYWSDYNAPLSWIPSDTSLANYHEFALGEKVLRVEPMGRFLFVYTDRAIYQGVYVGDSNPDLVFQFTTIPTENPLRFEHSLVNTGISHIYLSDNGVYVVTPTYPRPVRLEWIHMASAAIFNGIDSTTLGGFEGLDAFGPVNRPQCHNVVGGYNEIDQEVWFSWPTDSNVCPNMSLVLNLRYEQADLVDHGFTAFANYKPDYRPNIREWLNSEGICAAVEADFVKEGLPLIIEAGDAPSYLWNATENPDDPIDPDSWCARLGGATVSDLCENCDASPGFILADAEDFTLKVVDKDTFYRERYVIVDSASTWVQDGYSTLLQSDASKQGIEEEKIIKMVTVDFEAAEQEPPSELHAEVMYSAQPKCTTWKDIGVRELRCLTDSSSEEHETNNTRPDLPAKFPTFYRGRYLAYRFFVTGIGGSSCYSNVTLTVSKGQGRSH